MNHITFFKDKGLLNINVSDLTSCMRLEHFDSGEDVCIEGEKGYKFYFILSGDVEIFVPVESTRSQYKSERNKLKDLEEK